MAITARMRWELARRPWIYWLVVAAAVGVTVTAAGAVDSRAEHERRRWGTSTVVVVASVPIAAGMPLHGLELRHHPLAVVPDGALGEVPVAAIARRDVAAGQTLTELDLAPGEAPFALVPDGYAVVAVTERVPVGARAGHAVAVVTDGIELTTEGIVIGDHRDGVLVAVPRGAAPGVAAAATSTSGVSLVIHP